MGLDVIAHKEIKYLKNVKNYDDIENLPEYHDVFRVSVISDDWLDRIKYLVYDGFYVPEESKYCLGYSYSSHTEMRNLVCGMIGNEKTSWQNNIYSLNKGSDFFEWLDFADNEGVFDFKTCEKLHKDFKRWLPMAEKTFNDVWLSNYKKWMKAFKFASENGAIEYR